MRKGHTTLQLLALFPHHWEARASRPRHNASFPRGELVKIEDLLPSAACFLVCLVQGLWGHCPPNYHNPTQTSATMPHLFVYGAAIEISSPWIMRGIW